MNPWRTAFGLLLGRRLTRTSGSLLVAGITRPVRIRRDLHGIPVIEAQSEEDAWFGLGFCQGQDRAFQIEQMRRAIAGQLAEMAGPALLGADRFLRRLGLRRAAKTQLGMLEERDRSTLEAFARGVNAGRGPDGSPRRAHEFALLGVRPGDFDAADALGCLKLIGFALAAPWQAKLARLAVLRADGEDAMCALDPVYPEWLPVATPPNAPAGEAVSRLLGDLALLRGHLGIGGGSNNWAVAGAHTESGRPIVANDPHLPPTLPALWYLAHVRAPGFAVAGAAVVGTPGIAVGHNGRAAWGVTAGQADDTDLFLEELGADGRSVREGDAFVPCEVRSETIAVKGRAPVADEVLVTRRGPIVTPALPGVGVALSLRSCSVEPRPLRIPRLHEARSAEDVRRCFALYPAGSLNLVFGDSSGGIGWQLVGQVPRRVQGHGTLPLPAADPCSRWEDEPVPYVSMPQAADPPGGILATANAKPTREGDGPWLGQDWNDGYRQERILESLARRSDWNVERTLALQMDRHSLVWRDVRDVVLAAPAVSADAVRGRALLADWDGVVGTSSPAAAVYALFFAELTRRVVAAKAPRAAQAALGRSGSPIGGPAHTYALRRTGHLVRLLRVRASGYFAQGWDRAIDESLAAAVATLRASHGDDAARWAWGTVRPLTLRHPAGARAPLGRVFNRGPFPWGGDAHTVSQASVDPSDPTGDPVYIATLRMVVDLANPEGARFVLPGGQSGNPCSPHYDDLLPRWLAGGGVEIPWTDGQISSSTVCELRLEPANGTPPPLGTRRADADEGIDVGA